MNTFVLDASVGTKWFFEENLSGQALDLLPLLETDQIRAIVPDFFYLEMNNVCWIKMRQNEVVYPKAVELLEKLGQLKLNPYPDSDLRDVAFENASIYNISVYDALYISLSEIYGAPLITADEKLLRACKDKFNFIEHLKDFKVR